MAEKKDVKTVKAFKRGAGIEEQVLFDDEFNWDLVSEESSEHVHEKAAELDRIELDRMSLDESPEAGAEGAEGGVRAGDDSGPDTDRTGTKRSKKTIVVMAIAVIVLLACVGAGFLVYQKLLPKEPVEELTAHTYTASIRLSEEGPLELEPFVIPTLVSQKRKFVVIHVFLSVKPSLKDKVEAHLPEVRNLIYESLTTAWKKRTPRVKVRQLIDSINEMVDAPVVQKLVFEERQEDQESEALPFAQSVE